MEGSGFALSKLGWVLIAPGNALLLLLALGTLLLFTRWRRMGRGVVALGVLALLVVAVVPVGPMALRVLEDRFPRPAEMPQRIDGIVLLGGSVDQVLSHARGDVVLTDAAERLSAFVELARAHPDARLVYTGGSGLVRHPELLEPPVVQAFFRQVGFDPGRVLFEDRSRNTHENAVFTRDLVQPRPGETWLLVTSAFHMPRAVALFRKAGWEVVPYGTDYRARAPEIDLYRIDLAGHLKDLNLAAHEWAGLVFYRITGRTDELFPEP